MSRSARSKLERAFRRRGIELRLVYAEPDVQSAIRDPHRINLIRLARLRLLAPGITLAIIEVRQPVELSTRALLRCDELPIEWADPRKALGFA